MSALDQAEKIRTEWEVRIGGFKDKPLAPEDRAAIKSEFDQGKQRFMVSFNEDEYTNEVLRAVGDAESDLEAVLGASEPQYNLQKSLKKVSGEMLFKQ